VSGRFDAAYYRRYYLDPRSRVYSRQRHARLVAGVVSMVEWFGASVGAVLDVGAGLGWWGAWLKRHRPLTRVVSTELEPAICKQHGHLRADITTWRLEERFDLVVCQGVLPYLDDAAAGAALENLAAMNRGFLYLEAITQRDLDDVCDRDLTDVAVHERPGSFYLSRLAKHYTRVGCGLFYKKDGPLVFYELESLV